MIRRIVFLLEIFITFLLQTTVFQAFTFFSVVPNLLLILTVSTGFVSGKKTGLFVGFLSGLMIDIFYGDLFGFYALVYMYIGYVNGFLYQVYYDEDVKVPMLLVAGSDLVYGVLIYVSQFLLRGRTEFGYYFWHIIVPETVYTTLITLVLYRIYYSIDRLTFGKGKQVQR